MKYSIEQYDIVQRHRREKSRFLFKLEHQSDLLFRLSPLPRCLCLIPTKPHHTILFCSAFCFSSLDFVGPSALAR